MSRHSRAFESEKMSSQMKQISLFSNNTNFQYPSTRYQGSKAKIIDWIWACIQNLKFETCLDAFGGTGSVGYFLKCQGKTVTYNDNLKFNYIIGKSIIENDSVKLDEKTIDAILKKNIEIEYPSFIKDTYKDIFYLDDENEWLDYVITNIGSIKNDYKKALAFTALFQACIIKRPYNLFHRANLYMRTAEVKRGFGNKTTWDRPFPDYFRQFSNEYNKLVFSNQKPNRALCKDIFEISPGYDLVYIDTPYVTETGSGVDYLDFYHFLEGMLDYERWPSRISNRYKHKRLIGEKSLWCQKDEIHDAFKRLFEHFRNSIIIVSYRSHGIPSIDELFEMLSKHKTTQVMYKNYKYALSHQQDGQEVLLIGT
jgi:adenine-specific DNA methylase